ncbi:MAG: DsrE/DsrF/DrsH-like family protein [Candidatus Margulisbacteria bacterium]|jgi:peroxiredoxin family protein|nr:DsrE/DsrF/DrsH-like family protein [Candidatus Margulisiibacteriota bacterium]
MAEKKKKLSIIVFSGDYDKAFAAFTIASGAAALNYEVNLFFTFFGLNILKKKRGRAFLGKGFWARSFGFLLGGRNVLPLSRLNFAGLSPVILGALAKSRNVAGVDELIDASIKLGVNFYACETAGHILGLQKEDFLPEVQKVIGIGSFLEIQDGGTTLFI